MERWLPIDGYEGVYEVSDQGRVRSLDRVTHDGKHLRGQILAPFRMPSGHIRYGLGRYGKSRTVKAHRLVLIAFVGPPPEGMEALHRNGNPADNRLENLRWGTKSENAHDAVRHGSHPEARKTHCPAGHEYAGDNVYFRPNTNHRQCRECTRAQQRAQYAVKRSARAA